MTFLSRSRGQALGTACAMALCLASPASSQATDKTRAAAADQIPYPIPDSPASDYLGISPTKVDRPSSPKSLVTSLVNGIDENGKVRQGLAFEFAPGTYWGTQTLAAYQQTWGFIKANTRVSLATVRSAGDSASTDGSIGIRIPIFDGGDPLSKRAFTDSIGDAMAKCAPSGNEPPAADEYSQEKVQKCLADATSPLVKAFAKRNWNKSSLAFSLAVGTQFESSDLRRGRGTGAKFSVGWSWGAGSSFQGILAANLLRNEAQRSDSSYTAGNVGLRLLLGSQRVNGFVEGLGESRWNAGSTVNTHQATWSAGVEFLANDDTWISTGFGEGYKAKKAPDKILLFLGLRWGISSKARMAP